MIQMNNDLEASKLQEKLTASQSVVNVLRQRMNSLEEMEGILVNVKEVMTGESGEDALTAEERSKWLENMMLLLKDSQAGLDKLNENLSEFN